MKRLLVAMVLLSGALRAEVGVLLFQKELPRSFETRSPVRFETDGQGQGMATRLRVEAGKKGLRWEDDQGRRGKAIGLVLRGAEAPLRLRTPKGFEAAYEGEVRVECGGGRLRVLEGLEEERYVAAVVAQEIPGGWPAEAVKAQAVVGRTFMERNRGRHLSDGANFCDLAHCQVYRGLADRPGVESAVRETKGMILSREGRPAEVYFHADCGGHTAWAEDVWPGGPGGSPGSPDGAGGRDFCEDSPHHRWRAEITPLELGLLLDVPPMPDRPVLVLERDRSGRARRLAWGPRTLTGEELYLAWGRRRGWHELQSARFTLSRKGENFVFEGSGLGHGVGLCQYGARGRARAGFGFREILEHYFPGTAIR